MKILSFHLLLETEWNRVINGDCLSNEDIAAIQEADGIILPQGCSEKIYRTASTYCTRIFPNYDARFRFPGKTGQTLLFKHCGVPMPRAFIFQSVDEIAGRENLYFSYPFVFKSAWGGEGKKVFLVESDADLKYYLHLARSWENENITGFLLQEYVPTGGRSLRVTVIGKSMYPYWRVQDTKEAFYTNISKGAIIDTTSSPHLIGKACQALKPFCQTTGINLAGFDFIFAEKDDDPEPLFLEINYSFRTFGLGGPDSYLKLLVKEVREWRENF